jgi:DNA-binding transcriptional regulator GbsR (MarR family)
MIPPIFHAAFEERKQREIDKLRRQLGQVIAERDWLKKKSPNFH